MTDKPQPAAQVGNWFDERLKPASFLRRQMHKVYPDHWSFMMGEIALYSFIILLITGTYLTFFFDASMGEVRYNGSYAPLHDVEMSRAYASTLKISFDVRGGLVIRQIHHWAALLFLAAMTIHMLRIFFTGAFRKPRELNWLIGITMLTLGLAEGFAGYSLPDDLLSGTGLRIFAAMVLSIPVIGTWSYFLVFDSDFPGTEIIGRLYIVHVLLIPGIILALITIHIAIVVFQKHTQFPGAKRTEHNVVGERFYPLYATKAGAFLMLVFAVTALLGGLFQINPVWLYGPYNPAQVSAGSQPDWYIMFLEGSSRIWPSWEIRLWNHTISPLFWPLIVLPGIMFTLAALYPFLEARLTRDRAVHHLLQRPRDVPVRTSLGMMAVSFYVLLFLSGGNDIIASRFDISLNATTWIGRIAVIVVPPLAYLVTYRICLGLQRHDREVLDHGVETGIVKRLPSGEYVEVHQPLGPIDEHGHGELEYAGASVPKRMNRLATGGRRVRGFFAPIEEPAPVEELEPAAAREERRELAGRPSDPQG